MPLVTGAAPAAAFAFRRRRSHSPAATSKRTTPAATPTPIPAFAPLERPLDCDEEVAEGIGEVVDVGGEDVVVAEVVGGR